MNTLRSLTKNEIEKIALQNKDYEWVTMQEIELWLKNGNCVGNNSFCIVVLQSNNKSDIYTAFKNCCPGFDTENYTLALQIGKLPNIPFAKNKIQMLCTNNKLALLVPVKSTTSVEQIFKLGFELKNIRPLCNLRPFYIFTLSIPQKNMYNNKKIPICDTYSINKQIDNGFVGINQHKNDIEVLQR